MAQKHIVEVVIDEEQLLSELLMEDTGNQLQHTLLHCSACPIQLLLTAMGSHHKGQAKAEHSQIWKSDWDRQTPEATGVYQQGLMGHRYWCER